MSTKLSKPQVETLFAEMEQLEAYVHPKVDPTVWPPVGWHPHPSFPGYFYRMLDEVELREEIYGSEEKREWLKWAAQRIEEIKLLLIPYFFPAAKEEGTERKTKSGFVTMLKTGLKRKFDLPALAAVVAKCQEMATKKKLGINVEERIIKWEPALDLKAYRELPPAIQKQFDAALIIEPKAPEFEIVRAEDSEE